MVTTPLMSGRSPLSVMTVAELKSKTMVSAPFAEFAAAMASDRVQLPVLQMPLPGSAASFTVNVAVRAGVASPQRIKEQRASTRKFAKTTSGARPTC